MLRSKIAERVINYLASCRRKEVAMEDLVSSVMDDRGEGADAEMVYGIVITVLKGLAENDMVKISTETISPGATVPRCIYILPRMSRVADALMEGQGDGGSRGRGRDVDKHDRQAREEAGSRPGAGEGAEDAVAIRFHAFVDLMEKRGSQVRIEAEWDRLIAMLIYQDMEEYTGFQACAELFIKGLIWQSRSEQPGEGRQSAREKRAELRLRPELLGQIDAILSEDAEKNGEFKARKAGRKRRGNYGSLINLDQAEVQDFVRCLNQMRVSIKPGEIWQSALGMFFEQLLEKETVFDACKESFRAGVIFQMHRKMLEGLTA